MKFNEVGNRLYTGETSVDFAGKRKVWYLASLVILAVEQNLMCQAQLVWKMLEILSKQQEFQLQ
jgi:hypothetical protein